MRFPAPILLSLAALACSASCGPPATPAMPASTLPPAVVAGPQSLQFTVSIASSISTGPQDGRLLLVLAQERTREPRMQVSDLDSTAEVLGVDVQALAPGQSVTIDRAVLGYPVTSLADLPAGDYVAQAVLHPYETFVRGDGHTVVLPPDRGEGQDWTKTPGNLVSEPVGVHVDPAAGGVTRFELSRALPDLPPTLDTKYVKHVRFQSERLTKFW